MENITEMELISIQDGKAYISYRDLNDVSGMPNNGYNNIIIPVNLRELQYSSRGNLLTDQSIKEYENAAM